MTLPATTPSITPGAYGSAQNVSFTFRADVTQVAITLNGAPPSISKYIAYDTLTPPNPFIAVTEDGNGRVVYDGGFPKFYNSANPASPASFSALTPAGKYLYNALNWVANPTKVAAGNKKVLFLGDDIVTGNYPIKSTGSSGFYNTINAICSVAGFTPTIKDSNDYGGTLNPTLSEMEQYACVVFISSSWSTVSKITAQACTDVATYRQNGNGVVVITDHGYNLNTIADISTADPAFFKTANAIVSKFGTYFTGNYDRTPVQVGFLRTTYGDHPLYAGMADTDYVAAGASESRVVAPSATTYAPGSVPSQNVSANGLNTINVLALTSDGSMYSDKFVYNIQGTEFVFAKSTNPSSGLLETNGGKAWADWGGKVDLSMSLDGSNLGTVWGEILLNGKRIGEVYYSGGQSYTYWYAGAANRTPMRKNDTVQQAIAIPFSYTKSLTIVRPEFDAESGHVSLSSKYKSYRDMIGDLPLRNGLTMVFNTMKGYVAPSAQQQLKSVSMQVAYFENLMQGKLQTSDSLTAAIYATSTACATAVAAAAANPGTVLIDAQTSKVYAYKSGSIQEIVGLKPHDFFGSPRVVTSTVGGTYRLETNGAITKLT
ncbi:hypothetical protein [Ralstonia phage RP31]|uniref:Virion structural protein n=2 Tax=Ripduovirus RP12 TaxID=2560700 RepID=A0A1L7N0W2_9CAUD|nr:virion structural protein [Ralstonia phage RP12]BAW19110.1 hypothetical protein [Ralstonia phage RP12]BAW19396.1 hypothetical protein [Ralstonia phage RP31]